MFMQICLHLDVIILWEPTKRADIVTQGFVGF